MSGRDYESNAPREHAHPLRLIVVDQDDRTRESMVGLLGIRGRFAIVGSAGHIDAALRLVREIGPDVVVIDPRLPDVSDGLALIRAIRKLDPRTRILAVGWSPQLEHDALAAGAARFIRKTFRPSELGEAITRCTDGCEDGEGAGRTALATPSPAI